MEKIKGKRVSDGIVVGKIFFYSKQPQKVVRYKIKDIACEIQRYESAKEEALIQIKALYDRMLKEYGENDAKIFEAHTMLLNDIDLNESVHSLIRGQSVNAEYAVAMTADKFCEIFDNLEDEYFRERSKDINDVCERVIEILGNNDDKDKISEPCIIISEDLSPSETVQFDRKHILAFATEKGSSYSHTAILARMMDIPALVRIPINEAWHGKNAIIDGENGFIIIEPDTATLEYYIKLSKEREKQKFYLHELIGKETCSKKGKKINLYANISNTYDLSAVKNNDAEGIGLFRSEFLYLESKDFPTEDQQFMAYKMAAEQMEGKKVIIRTLDIGTDKKLPYYETDKEDNPAMGYRAIRVCLSMTEMFKTQLRAIYRASAYGNVSIMYPMITSLDEVKEIKSIVAEVKKELEDSNICYKNVEQGIMIETPAAAVLSDVLAKEVDFFSIGSNDLTQFTLAVDRQNDKLSRFYKPQHEAVLRLIEMTIKNAHKEGIWVGICGEIGADIELVDRFIEMGIDELSVSPGMVLPIRKLIRESEK